MKNRRHLLDRLCSLALLAIFATLMLIAANSIVRSAEVKLPWSCATIKAYWPYLSEATREALAVKHKLTPAQRRAALACVGRDVVRRDPPKHPRVRHRKPPKGSRPEPVLDEVDDPETGQAEDLEQHAARRGSRPSRDRQPGMARDEVRQ